MLQYADDHRSELRTSAHPDCADGRSPYRLRIFALTDGDDNSSRQPAWQVAQFLQDHHIVLDAIPLAGHNSVLQSMATASGGLSVHVSSEEQGAALFENPALLELEARDSAGPTARITDKASLMALENRQQVVEVVTTAAPIQASRPTMSAAAADAAMATRAASDHPHSGCMKRVMKEFRAIMTASSNDYNVWVAAEDAAVWKVALKGPAGSPFDQGVWMLLVEYPANFPFQPPKVRFLTPVFHPNVNVSGGICLNLLRDSWSPAISMAHVFNAIRELLANPDPDNALEAVKAEILLADRRHGTHEFDRRAREHTAQFASSSVAALKAQFNIGDDT